MNILTVIVPVYNTQVLVGRCIESILSSSYTNLEILVIDDGSTDNSLEICTNYAKRDPRIRIIHKENGGVAEARNIGMQESTGDYIVFCDSDDMVPSDAYQCFMDVALRENSDLVQGTIRRTIEDSGNVRLWKRCESDTIKTKIIGFQGVMVRSSLIKENNIQFPAFKVGEDNSFMIQVYNCAEKISYIEDIVYEYIIRSSNSSAGASAIQMRDFSHYLDELRWREWTLNYISNSNKLYNRYSSQMADFCPVISVEWLNYNTEQRQQCFEVLQSIVKLIDWENTSIQAKGYLQTQPVQIVKMNEAKYTRNIQMIYKIINPIKKLIGR